MANEFGDGVAPGNDTQSNEDNPEVDFSNAEAAQEEFQKVLKEKQELAENNKQLFARAKKAEGFELVNDEWVKPKKKEKPKKVDTQPNKKPSQPDNTELDYGQKAYLKAFGIGGEDEINLVQQFQERGFDLDSIVEDDVFTSKLERLRETKESSNAMKVPKSSKRGNTESGDEIEHAIAEYKDSGKLPQDFETRSKVVNRIVESEEKRGMFSGPSVIGGSAEDRQ